MTPNPYEPATYATTTRSTLPSAMACTVCFNLGTSLAAGAGIAIVCRHLGILGEDIFTLLAFFVSLAAVFGGVGAAFGCRYIQGRSPLWAIAGAIWMIAIISIAFSPIAGSVVYWIVAALAAISALLSTTIAASVSSTVKSDRQESPG